MRTLRSVRFKLAAMFGGPLTALVLCAALLVSLTAVSGALQAERADSVRITVVDRDDSAESRALSDALSSDGALSVTQCGDEASARRMLALGRAEGLLTIGQGYGDALRSDGDELGLHYESAPLSSSGQAVREIVSGYVVRARSRIRAYENAAEALGALSAEDEAALDALLGQAAPAAYTIETIGGDSQTNSDPQTNSGSVFRALSVRYEGFAALCILLCMLTLSAFFARGSSRLVSARMNALPGGAACAFFGDALALFGSGVLMAAIALIPRGDVSPTVLYMLAAYVFNLTGLCILITRFGGVGGRVDVLSPFLALLTGLIGGCFADTAALSPALRRLSLLTPQGLFLAGLSEPEHAALFFAVLFAAGAGMLLLSEIPALRLAKKRKRAGRKI